MTLHRRARPILAVVVAMALASYPAAAADPLGCGTLISYSAPTATRPVGQVSLNQNGRQTDFPVALPGTVTPPNITGIGTALNPVRAQLSGTVGADRVVRDFALTQVSSCPPASLPSTGTAPASGSGMSAVAAVGLVVLLVAAARRYLLGRTSHLNVH